MILKRGRIGKIKTSSFPKIRLPGEDLLKKIQFGTPPEKGIYLCFYKPNYENGWSQVMPMAGMTVAHFSEGSWGYNAQILAWIGPLPTLSLDELAANEECLARVFYIGTLEQAANFTYKSGPHPMYMSAFLQPGKPGEFIFEVNSHKTQPNPVSKFSTKKNNIWQKLKEPKKYIKMIKVLKKRNKK